MFHFVYKTINLKNNKCYIGVHSTNNINDGYLGSGDKLKLAIKKYGTENFYREILMFFDNVEQAYEYEASLVTEKYIKDDTNYNITVGGKIPPIRRGKDHHFFGKKRSDSSKRMKENNPSKLEHVQKMNCSTKVIVNIETGEGKRINKNEPIPDGWKNVNSGKILVKDKEGNCFSIEKNDPRYLSGELIHHSIKQIEYKGVYYNGYKALKEKTKVTQLLYKKYYLNGYDPEVNIGNFHPVKVKL